MSFYIPYKFCPLFKIFIMCYTSFEDQWFELPDPGRKSWTAWIAAFAMTDRFSSLFEWAYLAYAGHYFSIKLYTEFEILVRIKAKCVDNKLCICHNDFF